MPKRDRRDRIHARTVWISDVHLGFRGCSADLLLDFLHRVECERLYPVGDIIDTWSMKRRPYGPQPHNNVVRATCGITYCNCGDWVESCTALVQAHDGSIEVLRGAEVVAREQHARMPVAA